MPVHRHRPVATGRSHCMAEPSVQSCTASLAVSKTFTRDEYVDNNTRISRLRFSQIFWPRWTTMRRGSGLAASPRARRILVMARAGITLLSFSDLDEPFVATIIVGVTDRV